LIIAGFHRSGTSLVSQLLHRAGVFLGYDLMGASFSNPHGHYEDMEVYDLHERILTSNGHTWLVTAPFLPVITSSNWRRMEQLIQRRNAEHDLWAFKDPRVCLFMMIWKYLLPNAKALLVYRHFSDTTYSLGRRQSTEVFLRSMDPQHMYRSFWEEPDLALRMWLAHNELLLTFARTYPEDILAVSLGMVQNGFPVVRAVNQRWGLGLDEVPASEVLDPTVTEKRPGRQPISDRRLIDRVEATWQALEQLGERTKRLTEETTAQGR